MDIRENEVYPLAVENFVPTQLQGRYCKLGSAEREMGM